MVLSDSEYENSKPTPTAFTAPTYTLSLTILAVASPVGSLQAHNTHTEAISIYQECKNVENALIRHIYTALEDKYIEHLVNKDMGLLEDDILMVINYLFQNYSKLP